MRWPGQIKAGSVSDHQFAFYDLMPTFCDLAGISGYPDAFKNPNLANDYFDGISIYPTLMGQTDNQQKHDYLYWEFHETNMLGLRMGDWKMVVQGGQCKLFDLANDVHEDHDVSAKYPVVVEKMKNIIRSAHTENSLFKVTLP